MADSGITGGAPRAARGGMHTMKKTALGILGAAALTIFGLGVFCACNPDDPGPGPGPGPDPGSVDYTELLGEYASQVWVSTDGELDLAAQTFEGASSFELTDVSGSYGDTVISCTADGVAYRLTLNVDGALEMRNAETDALARTFMVDASAFAGMWTEDGNTSYYIMVSSHPDEEGFFGWKMFAQSGVTPGDAEQAVTVFMFNEQNQAEMFLYVPDQDVTMYYYGSAVYMGTGTGEMSGTQLVAYAGAYQSVYVNDAGATLALDLVASTVTYGEESYALTLGYGLYGAGLWFRSDVTEYALVRMLDGTYLISSAGSTAFAPYESDWLTGETESEGLWSSGNNLYDVSFESETSVIFDGEPYEMERYISEGDLVYRFMIGENAYVIRPLEGTPDAFSMESDVSRHGGYYFRNTIKQTFAQTFTNNAETLTVDANNNYYVTVHMTQTGETAGSSGTFTYLPELGAVALSYRLFREGATLYLTEVNTQGIYWALVGGNGAYASYASYFTQAFLPEAEAAFTRALEDGDDYFTAGGADPSTLRFDFDGGTVSVDGGDGVCYTWGYGSIDGVSLPDLYVEIGTPPSGSDITEYERTTLIASDTGLYAWFSTVEIDPATGMMTISDTSEGFYVPQSTFLELCGLSFVYDGAFVRQTIAIGTDGTLTISAYDASAEGSALMPATSFPYSLLLTKTAEGGELLELTYTPAGEEPVTIAVVDRMYAVLGSVTYSCPDLAANVGYYYDATYANEVRLLPDGGIRVNGRAAEEVRLTLRDGGVEAAYTLRGTAYTAVFSAGAATVNGQSYSQKTFDPKAFVGAYTVDGAQIAVSVTAADVNAAYSLTASINGISATPTLQYSAQGEQQLAFSVVDLASLRRISCTVTLQGGTYTVAVGDASVSLPAAEWSYEDFVFTQQQTLTGEHTFACVVKEGAPLYLFDGTLCGDYVVSVVSGEVTLTVRCGDHAIRIAQGGTAELVG